MQCFVPISIDLVKYFVNSKGKAARRMRARVRVSSCALMLYFAHYF